MAKKAKKPLGFISLLSVAIGVVVAQICFVTVLQGVGLGGYSFLISLVIAFILCICYVFSFAELSLMMPKAGGLGTYTEPALGHVASIVATLCGYLAPAIFGLPAELFLVEQIIELVYPGVIGNLGVFIVLTIMVLNLLGIEIFSTFQNILAFMMVLALLIIGVTGIMSPNSGLSPDVGFFSSIRDSGMGVLSLSVLAFWAFVGIEFTCSLVEEADNAAKNLPRAMISAAFVLLFLYILVALAGIRVLPEDILQSSEIPHYLMVDKLFGDSAKLIAVVIAITATCSTFNSVIASVPRMLLGMANNNQLPKAFGKLHPRTNAPWVSIVFVVLCILIPTVMMRNMENIFLLLMISAAVLWLLAYVIAHVNVIILRRKYPDYHRPFKTPWYPLPQIVGIVGIAYLIINNSPSPELTGKIYINVGIFLGITLLYAVLWVKFKMKKDLFEPEAIDHVF
jgi:amino acid transporter